MIQPVFKSPGGKTRIASEIVSLLPRHRVYLEPFLGSGSVLFAKPRSFIETVNDLDGEIANFHRVLRDDPERLVKAVELTAYAEEELWVACEPADVAVLDDVERARRLVVRSHMNIGARQRGARFFRYAGPNSHGSPASAWAALSSCIRAAGERLAGVQILCRDAVEVIRAHADRDVLVYADPPYPHETRTGHGLLYRHEMTDTDHEELLEALVAHPGPVVLSGYRCSLYNETLAGWRRVDLRGYAQSHGVTEEVLYLNPRAAGAAPNTLF